MFLIYFNTNFYNHQNRISFAESIGVKSNDVSLLSFRLKLDRSEELLIEISPQ